VTLNDLARQLNVSTATVSRALSTPEMVAPQTRERILEAVQKSGYRLNVIARALRTQKTRTLGLLVSDIRNTFFSAIVKAVEDVARENDYTVMICNADEDGRNEDAAMRLFSERQVSGVIHCFAGGNIKGLQHLQAQGIPLVDLDRKSGLTDVDFIVVNNERGASLAAQHLIDLGHRQIGMIAGPKHLSNSRSRLEGFRRTLRQAGIPTSSEQIEFGDFREASGQEAMYRLLALKKRPTALFVANNEMMAGALSVIRSAQVRIPHDLSVVGFDDAHWFQYLETPLTVVAQPVEAMGRRAAELLLARIEQKQGPTLEVFEPRLIIRSSTGSLDKKKTF
jgi:LacI family transcriptional regulator